MRPVRLPAALLTQMSEHARATYPEECCGFLIGRFAETSDSSERAILALERADNEFSGERRRRFLIRPEELRSMERRLEPTDRAVVGFYHSHPDHPGRPSQFDQDHAWPWYTYLVLSVSIAEVSSVGAFELDPDSATFREVPLTLERPAPPLVRG